MPFLVELRAVMDWVWTDTTLSLSNWMCVEDIYANIFIIKCSRETEKVPGQRADGHCLGIHGLRVEQLREGSFLALLGTAAVVLLGSEGQWTGPLGLGCLLPGLFHGLEYSENMCSALQSALGCHLMSSL